MSVQLKLDEMLEALQQIDPRNAHHFEVLLVTIGGQMATRIGEILDCNHGWPSMEGVAFAGICCPFHPKYRDQICPDTLSQYDDGGVEDWEQQATDEELPLLPAPSSNPVKDWIEQDATIDELCQAGLNSSDPKHWESALHDIMATVRGEKS